MGKRTEQEQAEQTIDALTLRVFVAACAAKLPPAAAVEHAAEIFKAVKAKERELGIGIRIDG